jgi:hypothetical protein
VPKVDEGHVLAFTAKLEFEDTFVERQGFLDVAHFKGNVVEIHSARSSGFGHEILIGRAVRGLHRNLGAQLPAASGFRMFRSPRRQWKAMVISIARRANLEAPGSDAVHRA